MFRFGEAEKPNQRILGPRIELRDTTASAIATGERMFNEVLRKELVVDNVAALNACVSPSQDDQAINEYFILAGLWLL